MQMMTVMKVTEFAMVKSPVLTVRSHSRRSEHEALVHVFYIDTKAPSM